VRRANSFWTIQTIAILEKLSMTSNAAKMHTHKFVEIAVNLDDEDRDFFCEKVKEIQELNQKLADLRESLEGLNNQELERLSESEKEFNDEQKDEENALDIEDFATDDPEEAAEMYESALDQIESHRYEINTTQYPCGVDILIDEIENHEYQLTEFLNDRLK
jgi:TolA-binding protein